MFLIFLDFEKSIRNGRSLHPDELVRCDISAVLNFQGEFSRSRLTSAT